MLWLHSIPHELEDVSNSIGGREIEFDVVEVVSSYTEIFLDWVHIGFCINLRKSQREYIA